MSSRVIITGGSGFIGTNLLQFYLDKNIDVLNLDISKPRNEEHSSCWEKADIRNFEQLKILFANFSPTHVVHLAARVDLNGQTLSDYATNIQGVKNVIQTINVSKSVKKTIFASSMLVCGVGYTPKDYDDYCPTTVYGESKIRAEKIIKHDFLSCAWSIVRPTSIWGPWFGEPYRDFFDLLVKKRFVYADNMVCNKTYGYVGNSIYQIDKLLFCENSKLHGKTFYIGDRPPINIYNWADEILIELGLPPARKVPFFLFKYGAHIGDLLGKLGVNFPMTSFRLKNMTTDNIINLDDLYEAVGEPPYSRKQGIKETLYWLNEQKA